MDFVFQVLSNTRKIFKGIIEDNTLEDLNKIPAGFNNNIIWNIGHVLVTEQLLAYKLSGLESSLSDEMIDNYRKGSKPSHPLSQEAVNEIKDLLSTTISQTKTDYDNGVFEDYTSYTVSTTGNTLRHIDDALQFIAVHEGLHYGYILALFKVIKA
ncbi:DinB family protein [Aestuariivivens sediminis]|uniref:DinB family protein n=1 Tax=Aestuariivivens sediminis TaxID=2913557 RepID=UPI001F580FD3|nr:DinB family protein [Aestuariivivens sediminis]